MTDFLPILVSFIIVFSLLSMGATSGIWSEKSGIINIAINGGFIFGAFLYSIVNSNKGFVDSVGPFAIYVGALLAFIGGGLFSILLAVPAINFKADQVVVGTGINMLATAISIFVVSFVFKEASLKIYQPTTGKMIIASAGATTFTGHHLILLLITFIVCGVTWFAFKKTSFGLRIKTAGENPKSLEEMGVSVKKIRYQSIIISGAIAGLGGMAAILYTNNDFNGNVLGMGFVALAIMIMGRRKIGGSMLFAAAFAVIFAVIKHYLPQDSGFKHIINMIPFISPIAVLALAKLFKYEINDPASLGKTYEKGER